MKITNKHGSERTSDKIMTADNKYVHFLDLELSIGDSETTIDKILHDLHDQNIKLKEDLKRSEEVSKLILDELKILRKRLKHLESYGNIK